MTRHEEELIALEMKFNDESTKSDNDLEDQYWKEQYFLSVKHYDKIKQATDQIVTGLLGM